MSFFFTLLDDSLRPRGSRDPLGVELLWSGIGRKLVGNLTTVTTHLDNFILTLVGFHLCVDENKNQTNWECFERFEQLTARARVRAGLPGVIGVRRIARSPDFPVSLGTGTSARILDDQRQAGLWGLYSTALAASNLTNGMRRPTPRGAEIAQMFLKAAPGDVWQLALDKHCLKITEDELDRAKDWIVALLGDQNGRASLSDGLLSGGDAPVLWQGEVFLQSQAFMKGKVDVPPARDFLVWLTERSDLLRDFAFRVLQFDEALILSTLTFNWLLGCHGRSIDTIEKQLAGLAAWPFRTPPIPDFSAEISDGVWRKRAHGLADFCAAMAASEWRRATELLLAHHADVAKGRGGTPWCYWEEDRIKVVMNTTPGTLPAAEEVNGENFAKWMQRRSNDFFISAFLAILNQANPKLQTES